MTQFYGPHGVATETLASGAPIPRGDFFDLDDSEIEDPHNARLIAEGKILEVDNTSKDAAASAPKTKASKGGS